MNDFNKGGFRKSSGGFGGRAKFSGDKKFGQTSFKRKPKRDDHSGERLEMFKATCSGCGKSCEVPFRPSGDKPVYCRECFASKRDSQSEMAPRQGDRGAGGAPKFERPQREYREHAPVHVDRGNEDIKQQLLKLEGKLNRILEIINPPLVREKHVTVAPLEVSIAPKKERKAKIEKTVVKKKVVKKTKK